jgi:hypothetical protein
MQLPLATTSRSLSISAVPPSIVNRYRHRFSQQRRKQPERCHTYQDGEPGIPGSPDKEDIYETSKKLGIVE